VAATIGVFDGVHRGHQELFSRVRLGALAANAASLVLTFDPYPIEVFAPSAPRHRISCRPVTLRLVQNTGMDHVWFLPFSRDMASWEPETFLDHLDSALELTCLWVGPDFRFGKDRAGDFPLLQREGTRRGFEAHRMEPLLEGDRPISSTWVRELLGNGDVARAGELLGHPFEIEGPVVHGQGLGARELVATANLELGPEQLLPRRGIYAGWAYDPVGRWTSEPIAAVASVGVRPTLGPDGEDWVEVHLLDWQGEIYGERLAFRFLHWIRAEAAFPGLRALKEAIEGDLAESRRRLSAGEDTSPLHIRD
jgi:riboflavin kinase/FMN adenylyltransferase